MVNQENLNQINQKRITLSIHKNLKSFMEMFKFERIDDEVRESIDKMAKDYLITLVDRKAIKSFSINTSIKIKTWKEIYPNLSSRMAARLYYFIAKLKFIKLKFKYDELGFFQKFFPFKTLIEEQDPLEAMVFTWIRESSKLDIHNYQEYLEDNKPSVDWIMNWLEFERVKPKVFSTLIIPYKYIDLKTNISFSESIDRINIDLNIEKTYN